MYKIPSSFPDTGILSGWSVLDKLQAGKGWKMRIVDRILKKGLIRDLELLKAVVEGKKVDDFVKKWSY